MKLNEAFNFLLVCLGMLLSGASFSIPAPIYPAEALQRGLSVFQSGIVLGSAYLSSFIFTPLSGKMIARFGAKSIFFWGSLICGLGNLGLGFLQFVENGKLFFLLSLALRVFSSIGEAAVTPTSYPLGAQQFPARHQGKAISVVETCFGLGMIAGPGLGGLLHDAGGFGLPFWGTGGVLVLIVLLGSLFFKTKQLDVQSDTRNTTWSGILLSPGVCTYSAGIALAGGSFAWYQATLEPHLLNKFGYSSEKTGFVMMTYSLTYTLLAPLFGYILDKGLSPYLSVLAGNFIFMLSCLTIGPVPQYVPGLDSVYMVVGSLVIQGLGAAAALIGSLIGLVKSTELANLPKTEQTTGMATSVWLLGLCFGSFIGAPAGSFFYDHVGFSWASVLLASTLAVYIVLTVICSALPRVSRKEGYTEIPSYLDEAST